MPEENMNTLLEEMEVLIKRARNNEFSFFEFENKLEELKEKYSKLNSCIYNK